MTTADDPADTEQLVLQSGADLSLTKPFDITDLLRRLGHILGDRPATGAARSGALYPRTQPLTWRDSAADRRYGVG